MWDKADWDNLEKPIKDLQIPPIPTSPSLDQLDIWFAHSYDALTALICLHTLLSRPSPKSNLWLSPSLTILHKEYAKACRLAKKHRTKRLVSLARLSRQGYFNAIRKAKNSHWAEFLAKTTPNNIWTAKRFVAPGKIPPYPELPAADSRLRSTKPSLTIFSPETRASTNGPSLP